MVKKYKNTDSESYTLGTTLTFKLLNNKAKYAKKLYFHPLLKKDDVYNKLIMLCEQYHIPYEENQKIFRILADKENCFVIGQFSKFYKSLDDGNHVILVNPQDMGNLGTIIRSCLGFGITNIGIIKPGVDCYNPKVVRSSMGAIFSVNIEYFNSFDEYLQKFSHHAIYPLMLQATESLSQISIPSKFISLIFGNEASGLPHSFLKLGHPIIIKHSNTIDSLNLPTAVGITLYEFTKNQFNRGV